MIDRKFSLNRVLSPLDIGQADVARVQAGISWNLARPCNALLDCLYVNPFYDTYAGYGPYLDGIAYADVINSIKPNELIEEDKKKLRALLQEADIPLGNPHVTLECDVGSVFQLVKDWIGIRPRESRSDNLIVITKSHSSGFSDFILGSLATRIVRSSEIPCLVLPEKRVKPSWQPKSVLIAYSLDNPNIVHQPMISLLPIIGCEEIKLLHAFKRESVLEAASERKNPGQKTDEVMYSLIEDNIRRKLEAAVESLPLGFAERDLLLKQGRPEEVIYTACAASPSDSTLLVVGRSAPATELSYLGSTLQHIVSAAEVPVLVLPYRDSFS